MGKLSNVVLTAESITELKMLLRAQSQALRSADAMSSHQHYVTSANVGVPTPPWVSPVSAWADTRSSVGPRAPVESCPSTSQIWLAQGRFWVGGQVVFLYGV